jgi:leader peptidase (prepilin peptidase)/N-methyltransferase
MSVNILVALLGWAGGALVNYLADVLPLNMRLAAPGCLSCGKPLPLANYLVWPRRCPACGRHRTWRTWVVELLAVGVALWLWQSPPQRLGFVLGLALLVYFGLVAVIDLEHRLILLPLSLAGVALGLAAGTWLQWQKTGSLGQAVALTLLGGAAGFAVMLLLYFLGGLFARWAARRKGEIIDEEALGFGDVHLGLILGLFLGWPAILIGLVTGIFFGGVAGFLYLIVLWIAGRHRWFAAIPYGPYLIAGAVFLLYFRDFLVNR